MKNALIHLLSPFSPEIAYFLSRFERNDCRQGFLTFFLHIFLKFLLSISLHFSGPLLQVFSKAHPSSASSNSSINEIF